ncbi:MAG TPA: co-chaperone DjlA [Steroidobacteraceae bacterium]|nr:co-chaperone DjlA [Steroidobacteraceae bacterium]
MQWKGKVIGGLLGAVVGAGPIGALVGLLLGHQYDRSVEDEGNARGEGDPRIVSAVFFRTTFAVMGCIAKADGRVSEREIRAARGVMQHLRLSEEQVQAAIRFFTGGKAPGFELERTIRELRAVCGRRQDLLRYFIEIQLSAALDGGDLQGPARPIVQNVGRWLGISGFELAHLEALLRLQRGQRPGAAQSRDNGGDAYEVLQVAVTASDAEVVKAYRRQMSRNHPDKLVANGLPESMQELAKQKTQRIREAYETIRAHRKQK